MARRGRPKFREDSVLSIQVFAWLVVSVAGYAAGKLIAKRKNFSSSWGFVCFFLPFLVIVLELAPSRKAATLPRTTNCPACQGTVSTQAPRCPHCGHQLDNGRRSSRVASAIEGACALIVSVSVGAFVWTLAESGWDLGYALAGSSQLPACSSEIAHQSVANAVANAPMGKVEGLSIVSWGVTQTQSADGAQEKCSAVVTLSNAATFNSTYEFDRVNGTTMVRFLLGDPIQAQ
jgi:hypothetical protein